MLPYGASTLVQARVRVRVWSRRLSLHPMLEGETLGFPLKVLQCKGFRRKKPWFLKGKGEEKGGQRQAGQGASGDLVSTSGFW